MPSHKADYLVIALRRTWTSCRGYLNAVTARGTSFEDAAVQRMKSVMEPPNETITFVVVRRSDNESAIVEWTPPARPTATAKVVQPDA